MRSLVAEVVKAERAQLLGTLVRWTGDLDVAEDALQDAVLTAMERFGEDASPRNIAAWLTTTARNKARDRLRRDGQRPRREAEAAGANSPSAEPMDPLSLLFTACHPAVSKDSQVALALRYLCGLSSVEIARAFLTPEATLRQRISRAKRKIREASIPFRVPDEGELPARLQAVLSVIYLVFTTGHSAPFGESVSRADLADEAMRMGRMLVECMPDQAEAAGLLSLMEATQARAAARFSASGEPIALVEQDRGLWDLSAVRVAGARLETALRSGRLGPYQIEASIACLHGEAASWDETDWPQIVYLYRLLEVYRPTPVVRVNRAVAEAELFGPDAGLELLKDVEDVESWHLYWAAHGEFLSRAGRRGPARTAYRRALECACSDTDRRKLEARLEEMAG